MKRLIGVGVMFVLVAGAASAATQCVSDADSSGTVTVDEIIAGVNNALDGCPIGCAHSFAVDTPSDDACSFVGPYSAGLFTVQSLFVSFIFSGDGQRYVGVSFVDTWSATNPSPATFVAQVTSASSASLVAWGTQPDGSDSQALSGTVTLNVDRMLLSLRPDVAPFTLSTWPFTAYAGTYTGSPHDPHASAAADSVGSLSDLQGDLKARMERMLNQLKSR